MSIASMMIHTCDIETRDTTVSPNGGVTPGWVSKSTDVPCYVQDQIPGRVEELAANLNIGGSTVVYFDHEAIDLANPTNERIVFNGRAMTVTDFRDLAGRGRIYRADCDK